MTGPVRNCLHWQQSVMHTVEKLIWDQRGEGQSFTWGVGRLQMSSLCSFQYARCKCRSQNSPHLWKDPHKVWSARKKKNKDWKRVRTFKRDETPLLLLVGWFFPHFSSSKVTCFRCSGAICAGVLAPCAGRSRTTNVGALSVTDRQTDRWIDGEGER